MCRRAPTLHSAQRPVRTHTRSAPRVVPSRSLLPAPFRVQLTEGLKGVSAEMMKDVVIAYEPVWAIGTGLTATPEVRAPLRRTEHTTLAPCAAPPRST